MRTAAGLAFLVLLCLQAATVASEPRGPGFGNGSFLAEIDGLASDPDIDEYVAPIAAGESLSVKVAARGRSALRPRVVLVDPDGEVVEPRARVRGGRVLLKRFAIDKTGTWAIRVTGDSDTEGAYAITTRIRTAKPVRLARQKLGGDGPPDASHSIDAVDGSRLHLLLEGRGPAAPVALRSIVGPDGFPIDVPAGELRVRGNRVEIDGLLLASGSGAYRVDVGIDAGEAEYSLVLDAKASRPRAGTTKLLDEPRIAASSPPVDGTVGQLLRVNGSRFPVAPPYPKVWIGDAQADVVGVGSSGLFLDVVVPDAPEDYVADVTVQNPDGQAATRAAYFHYLASGPLELARIEPANARIAPNGECRFKVTLTRVAQPPGVDVTVRLTTPELGVVPATVHVPGNAASAIFTWSSGAVLTTGRLEASYVTTFDADLAVVPAPTIAELTPTDVNMLYETQQEFTVRLDSPATTGGVDVRVEVPPALGTAPGLVRLAEGSTSATFAFHSGTGPRASLQFKAKLGTYAYARVTIAPPTTIDVSGWAVLQRYGPNRTITTFTIPDGTVLSEGDYLLIGTNATQSQFEASWWGPYGPTVHYFNGGPSFPKVDGEGRPSYELRSGSSTIDGPTVRMSGSGNTYTRTPATPAGEPSSWSTSPSLQLGGLFGPGVGQPTSPLRTGVYISAFSGSVDGHDWVEIFFDSFP